MGLFSKLTRPKPQKFIVDCIPHILEVTEAPLDMQFMAIGAPFDAGRRMHAKIYARAISSGTIIAAKVASVLFMPSGHLVMARKKSRHRVVYAYLSIYISIIYT